MIQGVYCEVSKREEVSSKVAGELSCWFTLDLATLEKILAENNYTQSYVVRLEGGEILIKSRLQVDMNTIRKLCVHAQYSTLESSKWKISQIRPILQIRGTASKESYLLFIWDYPLEIIQGRQKCGRT